MILIDALYINGGGGKVLLEYLLSELENYDQEVMVLIDKRIEQDDFFSGLKFKVNFMEASLWNRRTFYRTNNIKFSAILCFGNLPPTQKINATVYTYFHQLLYLKVPNNFTLKKKFLYRLKVSVLKLLANNTDYWLVQSDLVKSQFQKKYRVDNVMVLPFYSKLEVTQESIRTKNTYLYVSNATLHKNHQNLIDAFCSFFDRKKCGKLILTVSPDYPEIFSHITQKVEQGYPIENIGFVERKKLAKFYGSAEYVIYPSLAESFGLGLIEAIDQGCKVIGADLPYTHAVCKPSLTFNPENVESIVDALSLSLQDHVKPSVNKTSNQIDKLISLLR